MTHEVSGSSVPVEETLSRNRCEQEFVGVFGLKTKENTPDVRFLLSFLCHFCHQ